MAKENVGMVHEACAQKRHDEFQAKLGDRIIPIDSFIKMKFTEGTTTEHMWVKIHSGVDNQAFIGVLNNDPVYLKKIKCDDVVAFYKEDIEDIMI